MSDECDKPNCPICEQHRKEAEEAGGAPAEHDVVNVRGTVVHVYEDKKVLEVEFGDSFLATVPADRVERAVVSGKPDWKVVLCLNTFERLECKVIDVGYSDRVLTVECETLRAAHNTVLTCAFCGEAYTEGTPATKHEALTAHILECEKHPIAEYKADVKKWRDRYHSAADALRRTENRVIELQDKVRGRKC